MNARTQPANIRAGTKFFSPLQFSKRIDEAAAAYVDGRVRQMVLALRLDGE